MLPVVGIARIGDHELINIDRDYGPRLSLRSSLLTRFPHLTVQCSENATFAVQELYSFLVADLLPRNFPELLEQDLDSDFLRHSETGQNVPKEPPASGIEALRALGTIVDEDLMILQACPKTGEYRLQAYVVCFASGFALPGLIGKSLDHIHSKVPGYAKRLSLSTNRWFQRLEVNQIFQRCNVRRLQNKHKLGANV